MWWEKLYQEFSGRLIGVIIGAAFGAMVTWIIALRRRLRERRNIREGDARDTVIINFHLVESETRPDGTRYPTSLRIRALGQDQLRNVVPNGHLAAVLKRRTDRVTPQNTLISMEGAEGSFLLETLLNFVCDRVANGPFDHDLYVMTPCCEPAALATHQPITILLIRMSDLELFEHWPVCRGVRVEHGSDGSRVLTLREMAVRFKAEREMVRELRAAKKRTLHMETMYILDLALDRRTADLPLKPVPWERYEKVLSELKLS
jgi:hypothetical protein